MDKSNNLAFVIPNLNPIKATLLSDEDKEAILQRIRKAVVGMEPAINARAEKIKICALIRSQLIQMEQKLCDLEGFKFEFDEPYYDRPDITDQELFTLCQKDVQDIKQIEEHLLRADRSVHVEYFRFLQEQTIKSE